MIQSNELRIGNFVQSYADIITVEYVDKLLLKGFFHRDVVYNTSIQIRHCKPILLNEEWLIKLGFIKSDTGYYFDKDCEVLFYLNNEKKPICEIHDYDYKHIVHVHQLQNLYFALTQKELTL